MRHHRALIGFLFVGSHVSGAVLPFHSAGASPSSAAQAPRGSGDAEQAHVVTAGDAPASVTEKGGTKPARPSWWSKITSAHP